jgi:hypothetical protein
MADLKRASNLLNETWGKEPWFFGTVITNDKQFLVKLDQESGDAREFARIQCCANQPELAEVGGILLYIGVMWYKIIRTAVQQNGDDHFVV